MRKFFLGAMFLAAGVLAAQTSASTAANGSAGVSANQNGTSAQTSQQGTAAATTPRGGASGAIDSGANVDVSKSDSDRDSDKRGSKEGAQDSTSSAASAKDGSANSALAQGTTIDATLVRPIDAKKAKSGDEVVAKTNHDVKSGGRVVIAKGSKLFGHVTEASAKTKGSSESKLGIVFDKAVSKGQDVPLHASIQSISAAQAVASSDDLGPQNASVPRGISPAEGNGGVVGGIGSVARVPGAVGSVANGAAGAAANSAGSLNGTLDATTNATLGGATGIPGVVLNSSATGGAGSTLTSSTRNIHLDSGTQMVLATSSEVSGTQK